ncbi:hypothetical protein IQ06DRAFT_356133 [Phaeosphaeriaceae sp. SRC1lsM3a]|nr:hypothetical protein IQ06DRAFT_356133 [Stagonospora sp. SRC1lsM3a]
MKHNQHLLVALAALFAIGLTAPLPTEKAVGVQAADIVIDSPDAQKPYKSEVDAQAASKREDITIDSPDAQKPYKSEVDAQAAGKRDDVTIDSPDAQKPYKSEVDAQAAAGRV